MTFRKIILFLSFAIFSTSSVSANFSNQGFSSFEESKSGLSFSCEEQCIIQLGALSNKTKLNLTSTFDGNGNLAYGFLIGEQFFQGEVFQLNGKNTFSNSFDFYSLPVFSQIPHTAQVILVFNGKTSGKITRLQLVELSSGEKIKKAFGDFIKGEGIAPYTINLRYGTKLLGTSIVKIFYWIFAIGLLILFFTGNLNLRNSFYFALSLFLIVSFKNLTDYGKIYFGGVQDFYLAEEGSKSFYNMYDYYEFTDKARKEMGIDKSRDEKSCTYYSECVSDWPYCYHWRATFLRPCKNTKSIEEADFILLFKKDIPEDLKEKEVLYSQNQNYLLKN